MRRIIKGIALPVAALISVAGWAQDSNNSYYGDDYSMDSRDDEALLLDGETDRVADSDIELNQNIEMQEAGTANLDNAQGTSQQEVDKHSDGYLWDEQVGVRPQVGVINFRDATGDQTVRGAAGITVDANLFSMIDDDLKQLYLGPSIGAIYSRVGSTGANFFGGGSTTGESANFLLLPMNAKAGFNFTPNFRVAAHGGANLIYRSRANVMQLGLDNSATAGSDWSFFPNVGADLEFGLGKNLALTLRPDWTFTDGEDIRTGTIALAIPIG
jgi:hypothetical protein